jgi:hypothetical protein
LLAFPGEKRNMPLQHRVPRCYKGKVRTWLSDKKKSNAMRTLGMSQRLMMFIMAELCMNHMCEDHSDDQTEVIAPPA